MKQREAIKNVKERMRRMAEYEELKSGKILFFTAGDIQELPKILIQARVAQNLTQEELAQKLGMKQQQIQRYEADFYSSASVKRLQDIADILGIKFTAITASLI